MDLFEAIETRRSIRRFSDRPVEDGKVTRILDAVRHSPSWANKQCWRFVLVRDPMQRQNLAGLSNDASYLAPLGYKSNPASKGMMEAPIIIVACALPTESGSVRGQDYYLTDLGIACQTLMLATHALELATVFVGIFDEVGVKELLAIPDDVRVCGLFPLGYPLKAPSTGPTRKSITEITYTNQWGW